MDEGKAGVDEQWCESLWKMNNVGGRVRWGFLARNEASYIGSRRIGSSLPLPMFKWLTYMKKKLSSQAIRRNGAME